MRGNDAGFEGFNSHPAADHGLQWPRNGGDDHPFDSINEEALMPGLIGARLREKRLARGVSLRQFARDLEVSASFISQLETGKAQPSVATLFAICSALDIATDELFESEDAANEDVASNGGGELLQVNGATDAGNNAWRTNASYGASPPGAEVSRDTIVSRSSSPVVHPHHRKILVLDSGVTWESLTTARSDKTDFMFVRYEVGGSSTNEGRLIRHIGTEYGFVLSGTLEITLGFETHRLDAGDSISFDSSRPHRLANIGDVPVEAIWVNIEMLGSQH
jgi:transcriptional regulator with XRE-family HTH domain/mannose-6-phosphate isomerase-like protein (cupin superfamily)